MLAARELPRISTSGRPALPPGGLAASGAGNRIRDRGTSGWMRSRNRPRRELGGREQDHRPAHGSPGSGRGHVTEAQHTGPSQPLRGTGNEQQADRRHGSVEGGRDNEVCGCCQEHPTKRGAAVDLGERRPDGRRSSEMTAVAVRRPTFAQQDLKAVRIKAAPRAARAGGGGGFGRPPSAPPPCAGQGG